MARDNLNQSEEVLTNTTAASKLNALERLLSLVPYKYPKGPEPASIEIPPFRPHFIKSSKTVLS